MFKLNGRVLRFKIKGRVLTYLKLKESLKFKTYCFITLQLLRVVALWSSDVISKFTSSNAVVDTFIFHLTVRTLFGPV